MLLLTVLTSQFLQQAGQADKASPIQPVKQALQPETAFPLPDAGALAAASRSDVLQSEGTPRTVQTDSSLAAPAILRKALSKITCQGQACNYALHAAVQPARPAVDDLAAKSFGEAVRPGQSATQAQKKALPSSAPAAAQADTAGGSYALSMMRTPACIMTCFVPGRHVEK